MQKAASSQNCLDSRVPLVSQTPLVNPHFATVILEILPPAAKRDLKQEWVLESATDPERRRQINNEIVINRGQ